MVARPKKPRELNVNGWLRSSGSRSASPAKRITPHKEPKLRPMRPMRPLTAVTLTPRLQRRSRSGSVQQIGERESRGPLFGLDTVAGHTCKVDL